MDTQARVVLVVVLQVYAGKALTSVYERQSTYR